MQINRIVYWGARLLLGTLFLTSGVMKLISPRAASDFAVSILPVSDYMGTVIIWLLSTCELVLGYLILRAAKERYTSVIALLALLFFLMVGALYASPERSCGCFGTLVESKVDEMLLLRNMIFMFIELFLVRQSYRTTNRLKEHR
jgi:uncharacterized membrane protein YphA (DoxX/SURF4 family)